MVFERSEGILHTISNLVVLYPLPTIRILLQLLRKLVQRNGSVQTTLKSFKVLMEVFQSYYHIRTYCMGDWTVPGENGLPA